MNAQKNLLEIMNIRKVLAKINIPENDMIFINPGKEVTIRLDSIAGETFEGVVKTLGLEADLNTHKFPAEIAIDNPNIRLFPGMVARVEMMTVYMENQILIPRSAVMNSQGRKTVFVEKASKVTRRKVTLEMTIKNRVQVLSGLKINDKLIIFGQDKLSEGDMVAISH